MFIVQMLKLLLNELRFGVLFPTFDGLQCCSRAPFSFLPKHCQTSSNEPINESRVATERGPTPIQGRVDSALKIYLENIRAQKRIMDQHRAEFELGKRHLANIMGLDPENITQEDIDEAIQYLFPSGLFDLKARPVMKPPDEIFPKLREFEFDTEGRPMDSLFFTSLPKFYRILSEINKISQQLVAEHDKMVLEAYKNGRDLPKKSAAEEAGEKQLQVILSSSNWIDREELSDRLNENIREEHFANLIVALEHMITLPGAYKHIEFIKRQRTDLSSTGGGEAATGEIKLFVSKIPKVELTEEGHRFAISRARAHRTTVEVTVTDRPGEFIIDGHHTDSFQSLQSRELLFWPLILCGFLGKMDITATTIEGSRGATLLPRAIMNATSLCIAALYPEHAEKLRLAGLLTFDPRKKERMKINQKGARAKWRWLKR